MWPVLHVLRITASNSETGLSCLGSPKAGRPRAPRHSTGDHASPPAQTCGPPRSVHPAPGQLYIEVRKP